MENEIVVVLVTAGSADEAERLARHLLDARLAACVNVVGPVRSLYRWNGALQDDTEWQLLAKTRRSLFAAVADAVRAVHSYENPEILALPVAAAAPAYGAWVLASTRTGA